METHYIIKYKRKEDTDWMTLSTPRFNNLDSALNCERSEKKHNGAIFDYKIEMQKSKINKTGV